MPLLATLLVVFVAVVSAQQQSDLYSAYVGADGKLNNWASTNPTYMILNSTRVGM
jgi:hypothetical protein